MKQYIVIIFTEDDEVEGTYGPYGADNRDMVANFIKNGLGIDTKLFEVQLLRPLSELAE